MQVQFTNGEIYENRLQLEKKPCVFNNSKQEKKLTRNKTFVMVANTAFVGVALFFAC